MPPFAPTELERSRMTIFDLIKATVVCGLIAFLIYSYPLVGQIVLISFLSLLWLFYAHRTISHLRRR
jgi:cell division protein FtsW (lipid II flippase)